MTSVTYAGNLTTTYSPNMWTTLSSATTTGTQWVPTKWQGQVAPAGPPPEFNRFVNASDLLEEFIAWLGGQGVRQGEVLTLPLDLFVKWLIIRACEQDKVEPGVVLALPAAPPQPRCLGCQRFMRRDVHVPIHDERCSRRYFARASRGVA